MAPNSLYREEVRGEGNQQHRGEEEGRGEEGDDDRPQYTSYQDPGEEDIMGYRGPGSVKK